MVVGSRTRRTRQKMEKTEGKDRISNLPDEVLGLILSSLPTKYAVATSILSPRWRNLYQLSSNLDFDDALSVNPKRNSNSSESFRNFVTRVLDQCKNSPITRFRLKCGKHFRQSGVVADWLDDALNLHKVTELELSVQLTFPFDLQLPLMACQNLRVLKLDCTFILHVPSLVTFPCLRVLYFEEVTFPRDSSIFFPDNGYYRTEGLNAILRGCPLLEELVIIGCDWKGTDLYFCNPLLKKLTLDVGLSGVLDQLNGSSIYFNLPSLVYLMYSESLAEKYVIRNLSSVTDAHFEVGFNDDEFEEPQDLCDTMLDLIYGVSNCKSLYLSGQCLEALTSGDFELPVFQNLTRLKLGQGVDVSWNDVLLDFLSSSRRLEHLTLVQGGFAEYDTDGEVDEDFLLGDEPIPCCVSSCLKAVKLEGFSGLRGEMEMVLYFLEKANALEEMVICWARRDKAKEKELKLEKEKEILKYPKASNTCSISFK